MNERSGILTHRERQLTLLGNPVAIGDKAPNVTLRDANQHPVDLDQWAGKVCLISVVPALDTYICDLQTKRFNEEAAALGDEVAVIAISAEHPHNQKRWCGETGADQITVLSDHYDMSFGTAYGTYIKEYRLEQRSIFVIDSEGRLSYVEYVPEIAQHPDYDSALAHVRQLVGQGQS